MGRELQKRKKRSGLSKVRHKPKSKKKIFGNAIIAANWDQGATLSQNYQRLGLATRLNAPSGGIERKVRDVARTEADGDAHDKGLASKKIKASRTEAEQTNDERLAITNKKATTEAELIPTEARIERDPATGRILRVIEATSTTAPIATRKPLDDPLNDFDDDSSDDDEDDEAQFRGFDNHAVDGFIGSQAQQTDNSVLRQLEDRVAQLQRLPKQTRRQSEREVEWVSRMVRKHGDDYGAMFRDRKLNVMQQSQGDIARRVRKFLSSSKA